MLKRRSAERLEWQRVLKRRFACTAINDIHFTGVVTLLCIDAVSEPLWIKTETQDFCIADAGYSWLQHFPTGENYAVTTMFNEKGQVIQWYIDIVKEHGIDRQSIDQQEIDAVGIPWWDDLYLDIVVTPDTRQILILDEDELDDARQVGVIDEQEHRLAWQVARELCTRIEQRRFPLLDMGAEHRQRLLVSTSMTR